MAYTQKSEDLKNITNAMGSRSTYNKSDCPNPPCNTGTPMSLGEAFKQKETNRTNNTVNLEVKSKSKKVYEDGEIYNESIDPNKKLTSEEKKIDKYAKRHKLGKYQKSGDAAPFQSYAFNKAFGNKDKYRQKKTGGELKRYFQLLFKGEPDKGPTGSCGPEGCSAYGN